MGDLDDYTKYTFGELTYQIKACRVHTQTNRFLAMKVTTQQEDYLISHMKYLPWIFFSSFNLMQHRAPKTIRKYNDGHILSKITLTSYN